MGHCFVSLGDGGWVLRVFCLFFWNLHRWFWCAALVQMVYISSWWELPQQLCGSLVLETQGASGSARTLIKNTDALGWFWVSVFSASILVILRQSRVWKFVVWFTEAPLPNADPPTHWPPSPHTHTQQALLWAVHVAVGPGKSAKFPSGSRVQEQTKRLSPLSEWGWWLRGSMGGRAPYP